jgi:hypothetical protein
MTRPPRDPSDDWLRWQLRTSGYATNDNPTGSFLAVLALVSLYKGVPSLARVLLLRLPAPYRAACVVLGRLLGTLLCLATFVLVGVLFAVIVVYVGGR